MGRRERTEPAAEIFANIRKNDADAVLGTKGERASTWLGTSYRLKEMKKDKCFENLIRGRNLILGNSKRTRKKETPGEWQARRGKG